MKVTRLHPDQWLGVAGAGGAGAAWGLGLARLMAEVAFWTPLYSSPLLVAAVAAVCAVLAAALWLWLGRLSHSDSTSTAFLIPFAFPLLYATGIVSHPLAGCVLLVGGPVLAALVVWGDRARWMPPAALGLVVFILYLRTLLPSVGQADAFEFQVVVPLLRVAHPTGYPLYILLGKLFTLLPLGNVAWRVNLASAVFATAAVLMNYALLVRLITLVQARGAVRTGVRPDGHAESSPRSAGWLPAFLAAPSFAWSFTFWSQAVVAEVYTLHNLLVAVILWFLLFPLVVSNGRDDTGRREAKEARRWQAVLFLLGLSLTNHLTTALLLPAVAIALLWERPRLRIPDWLIAGGLFVVGLSVYLFIPLRWPALNDGEWMTLREFLSYVTGGQFHGALQLDGWRDPTRWGIAGRMLREPFGWIGLGLAALGVVGLAARQRRALTLTGVTLLAFVLYGLVYYVPDISVFMLPAHFILAVWIGVGIALFSDLTLRFVSFVFHPSSLVLSRSVLVVPFALLPLSRIWMTFPLVDQSHNRDSYAWGQYVLSLPLASGGAVLADMEKFPPLYYLQQIEGLRPDLDFVLLGSEELYYAELAARLGAGQAVYLARYLPNLGGLQLRSLGPLVGVRDPARDQSNGDKAPEEEGVGFGSGIRLLTAELSADPLDRALYHVTLIWRAEMPVDGDFVVRLRLVDADGQVRWESAGTRPVGGLYPTNAWPVGVAISDYHEVAPPSWLPRGEYGLEVGLFPPFDGMGLGVGGGATPWLAVGRLIVDLPSNLLSPLPRELRHAFVGGGWLTGYDLSAEAPLSAPFVVDLSWHAIGEDAEVRLAWVEALGQEVDAATSPLVAGAVRSRHVITAPQSPGEYVLRVGLVGEAARCDWLASLTDDCPLATVDISSAREGLANFADMMLLLEADVGRSGALPGEIVPVTLRWRALRSIDEDYTVFVQLIGPDGRLHGQVDMWPVQGSYPTSQWAPSGEVSDPYEVRLNPDAPPGPYRVEVGWYLLATMQRLQILDASWHPVGDSFVVGEFSVGD